jgi:magnesium transporter
MIEVFYFDGELKRASPEDLKGLLDKKVWVDVTNITKEEALHLEKVFKLHPITTEDLIAQNTRVKVEEFPNYLVCVFYGLTKSEKIQFVEQDYVLGENFIISSHFIEIPSYTKLKNHPDYLATLLSKGVDFVFHRLLDHEVDNFLPVIETFDDEIEMVDETATGRPTQEKMQNILRIKREIHELKKTTHPMRDKVSFLTKEHVKFISEKAVPYFRDVHDHTIRISDAVESYREEIGSTFEVYMAAISNSMNEVMKVLSMIATMALPLTVISGIYGTNFANLPGSQQKYGFWGMILAMVCVSTGFLLYYKRRKWI